MLDELLLEYRDKFDDNFPIMSLRSASEDEIIRLIKDCIDKGKPYEIKYNLDVQY